MDTADLNITTQLSCAQCGQPLRGTILSGTWNTEEDQPRMLLDVRVEPCICPLKTARSASELGISDASTPIKEEIEGVGI